MRRLETNHAQAILRLSSNSDFAVFCEWLKASLADADVANRKTEGAALHRSQGEANTLDEILRAPDTARHALARANRA